MKLVNALAKREFLVMVAIVASAVTLQVREHVGNTTVQPVPSHAQAGRMCAPSASTDDDIARPLPADCDLRTTVRKRREIQVWV